MSTSALGYVYAYVRDALADSATSVVFGRREPARQINQGVGTCNRVVFDPQDGGSAGTLAPVKYPGGNPRPAGAFIASCTVYVWAIDVDHANDELAQYEAVSALQGRVYAAIRKAMHARNVTSRAVHGHFTAGATAWVGDKIERNRGAEWSFKLTITENVFDVAVGEATGVTGSSTTTITEEL